MNIKNKVVIITGGSKGIGGGITTTLAKEGAIPVVVGRNEDDVQQVLRNGLDESCRRSGSLASDS